MQKYHRTDFVELQRLSHAVDRLEKQISDVIRKTSLQLEASPQSNRLAVSSKDAARRLDVSLRFLEGLRKNGKGPKYRKVGSRVIYRLADLDAWLVDSEQDVEQKERSAPCLPKRPTRAA